MSYYIVRMHREKPSQRVHGKRGLTLEEVQAHCARSDTHGDFRCALDNEPVPHEANFCPRCGGPTYPMWFDGYEEDK